MPTTYDSVRYLGSAFAQTHPTRLATIASFFGMNPAPVEKCRVLEVGCGDGGNLIPMALELPESQFTGIDLSEVAVAEGKRIVEELGVQNIDLRAMNIMDVTRDLGEFDYIVAHGVFAWVPEFVQEKLLELSARNLAPNGVAYISYNAYPGAHLRSIVRDMMVYYLGDKSLHDDPVKAAVPFLEFMKAGYSGEEDRRQAVVKEIDDTLERAPWVVYHDELAEAYQPEYFHKFVSRAAKYGLQFLSEAQFQDLQQGRFSPGISAALDAFCGDDRIKREQFWDFLRCRKFRASLLTHANHKLDFNAALSRIPTMYSASRGEVIPADGSEGSVTEFRGPHGASVKTEHPVVKAALQTLIDAWPESVPFEEVRIAASCSTEDLSPILLAALHAGLVQLESHRVKCVNKPGTHPKVSKLVRRQAEAGSQLTTLRHSSVEAGGEIERFLVGLLDGTRDHEGLLKQLMEAVETDAPPEVFREMLDANLAKIARLGLLLA